MARAAEAASAVNALLQFPEDDQQALLEILEDYFTVTEGDSDTELDSDDEMDTGMIIAINTNIKKIKLTMQAYMGTLLYDSSSRTWKT